MREMVTELTLRPVRDHKARVCVVYTGGTIGAIPRYRTNLSLYPASLDSMLSAVPEFGEEERIELGLASFREPLDSTYVTTRHWLALASFVERHYDAFDGFVILHGTDTMAYTASALSFLFNNLAKPVVVTGSQLPIRNRRGDAVMNLAAALQIAGYPASGLPCIPEVTLCFMDRLLRGNRATKVSAGRWQGFDSPNCSWLATIGERISVREDLLLPHPDQVRSPFFSDKSLCASVKVVFVNPCLTPEQLDQDLRIDGLEGAVLLTYGSGNMPTPQAFLEPLRMAIAGGNGFSKPIPVLNITQCLEGTVDADLYEAGAGLAEAGVANGSDLTPEAAVTKMCWALGRFTHEELRAQLQVSHRGEQSTDAYDLRLRPCNTSRGTVSTQTVDTKELAPSGPELARHLRHATVHFRGLQTGTGDGGDPVLRLFVNRHDNAGEAGSCLPEPAGQFQAHETSSGGTLVATVTSAVRNALQSAGVSVTLSAADADIRCDSIRLSVVTDAG